MFKSGQHLLIFILIPIIALVYLIILSGFFQQDEWIAFGNFFSSQEKNPVNTISSFFAPNIGHYVPLHHLTFYFFFSLFSLHYPSWTLLSILWHLLIVFLVFIFASKLFQNNNLGLLTAALFGLGASGHQATSWVVADLNTHGASLFGILALIFFFNFLKTKNRKEFWVSAVALIISLLFKEITIALFLLLPIAFYLFSDKNLVKKRFYPAIVLVIGLVYIGFRVSIFLFPGGAVDAPVVTESQSPQHLTYNLATFPIKGIAQTIVPPFQLWQSAKFIGTVFSDRFGIVPGTNAFDVFVENKILEPLSFAVFLILLILFFTLLRKGEERLRRIALFGLVWVGLNSIVYAFSPARSGIITIIDSRNLYFPSIGTAIFLTSVAARITAPKIKRSFVLLLPLILLNIVWLRQELEPLAESGQLRRSILNEMKTEYPDLSDKVFFYTESDKAYYGLPDDEKILPFQSGFGQTLLVWYYATERWPKEFLKERFLWEITEQGYRETGDRGFGYFRDFEALVDVMKENNISPESVIAYRYDSESLFIEDITTEVKGRLAGYFAEKRKISASSLSVSSSENKEQAYLTIDGDRTTAWDSRLAYANPQYFEIDPKAARKIAQVRIDSYNNKDQNAVGYRVLLSDNGEDWRQVFFAKRYPPGENGLVSLYFEPQMTRYVRIEQVGEHNFATWVIHELTVYEAY